MKVSSRTSTTTLRESIIIIILHESDNTLVFDSPEERKTRSSNRRTPIIRTVKGIDNVVLLCIHFLLLLNVASSLLPNKHLSSSVSQEQHQQRQQQQCFPSSPLEQRKPLPMMKAWTCHGRSQKEMVDRLAAAGIISSQAVKQALIQTDRINYTLQKDGAYIDAPQPMSNGQTISAPHMHAHVLEELLPTFLKASKASDKQRQDKDNHNSVEIKVLDVGCGSGYLTAALGRMLTHAPLSGRVFGIDVFPDLVAYAKSNIQKSDSDLLTSHVVSLQVGDGWKGLPEHAPFHAIHVGAAAAEFPKNLMMQLMVGGVMVIPVGPDGGTQNLYRVERTRTGEDAKFEFEDFNIKPLLGVRYVPLIRTDRS